MHFKLAGLLRTIQAQIEKKLGICFRLTFVFIKKSIFRMDWVQDWVRIQATELKSLILDFLDRQWPFNELNGLFIH